MPTAKLASASGRAAKAVPLGLRLGERMNRTDKDAITKRYHHNGHEYLRAHFELFLDAYNHARRLKTLRGLTPAQFM